jgi:hypothetical protein
MMAAVEDYLALRRTAGFAMSNAEYLLRGFARFAAARGERHVRAATLIAWASQGPSVAQRCVFRAMPDRDFARCRTAFRADAGHDFGGSRTAFQLIPDSRGDV